MSTRKYLFDIERTHSGIACYVDELHEARVATAHFGLYWKVTWPECSVNTVLLKEYTCACVWGLFVCCKAVCHKTVILRHYCAASCPVMICFRARSILETSLQVCITHWSQGVEDSRKSCTTHTGSTETQVVRQVLEHKTRAHSLCPLHTPKLQACNVAAKPMQ